MSFKAREAHITEVALLLCPLPTPKTILTLGLNCILSYLLSILQCIVQFVISKFQKTEFKSQTLEVNKVKISHFVLVITQALPIASIIEPRMGNVF